jgi:uncharacterized protein with GYD domain
MPKFMFKASYTAEGSRGVMKEGGTARRAAVQRTIEALGGKIEAFYFVYGEDDVYTIAGFPDAASGLAVSLAVNASGIVRVTTIPLITVDEMDAACEKNVAYQAPRA